MNGKRFAEGFTACAVLAALTGAPARAGLIGDGTNTVNAMFYLSSYSGVPEIERYGNPPVMGPAPIGGDGVNFLPGYVSRSAVHVGDETITITNVLPPSKPFCSVSSLPCPDSFTGFEFIFSAGVNIVGVSVDPASAAAMQPVSGGLLSSAVDMRVNLTGAAPIVGDQLILNLSFGPPASVPEPPGAAWMVPAVLGMFGARYARRSC